MRWLRPSVAVAAAAVLLGLAGASGPYFVSSVGTQLLGEELRALGDDPALLQVDASAVSTADDIRSTDQQIAAELEERGLPAAGLQVIIETFAAPLDDGRAEGDDVGDDVGDAAPVRLNVIGRPGGREHLLAVVDDVDGDFAVMSTDVARLPIDDDATITLQDEAGDDTVQLTAGPVVETFRWSSITPVWRPVSGLLIPPDDPTEPPPPPALLGDTSDVLGLLDELADAGVADGREPTVRTRWTVTIPQGLTLERAGEVQAASAELAGELAAGRTELAEMVGGLATRAPLTSGQLDTALGRAHAAVDALAVPVQALAVVAQLVAVAVTAAGTVLGGRSFLRRGRLWRARGVAPVSLGLRAAGLAVLPVAVGLVGGWWLAGELVGPLTGGAVAERVRLEVVGPLAVAGVVAVLAVGTTVAVAVARAGGDRPGRRIPPVADAVVVALAVLALGRARTRGGVLGQDPDGAVTLDLLAVAAPLLLVLAGGMVGTRLLRLALRGAARRSPRGAAAFLASRRLRSLGGAGFVLTFVAVVSAGAWVFASTLERSAEATLDETARTTVGAAANVTLPRTEDRLASLDLDEVAVPTSTVRRVDPALLDDQHDVTVLAVDPDTFTDVAHVPRGVDADRFSAGIEALEPDGSQGPWPAIVAGDARVGDVAALVIDEYEVAVAPVDHWPQFPGMEGTRTAVVVADDGALAPGDQGAEARLATRRHNELWVADGLPAGELRAQLERIAPAGGGYLESVPVDPATLVEDVRDDPQHAPVAAVFRYLRGQAGVVAVLGLLGLGAHHLARRRQDALSTALAVRMGLTRRDRRRADLIELGGLLTAAAVVATAAGVWAAHLVLADYHPLPEYGIDPVFAPPLDLAVPAAALLAAVVVVTVAVTARVVDRADVAALLRGEP